VVFEVEQSADQRVQFHAFVDLECGGRECFSGDMRGADILATVALNAGIRIEHARPGEFLEFAGPELYRPRWISLKAHRGQHAGTNGLVVGMTLERVVEHGGDDVNVFAAGKVRQENQDAAEGSPEGHVPHDGDEHFARTEEVNRARDECGERLEPVRARLEHFKNLAKESHADMEGDEARDDA
jgi:hypothetical protein